MPLPPLAPDQIRAYWYGLINYEQRTPSAADLKLDRMRRLMTRLGDPQRRLRIVHIAGTKGKGSIAAMLSAILRRAGYRTGLFTSPHLCRVEERFQVNGAAIADDELTALLNEVRATMRRGGIDLLRGGDGGRFSALRAPSLRDGRAGSGVGRPLRFDERLPAGRRGDCQHQLRSYEAAGRPAGEHRVREGGHCEAEPSNGQRRDGSRGAERNRAHLRPATARHCGSSASIFAAHRSRVE